MRSKLFSVALFVSVLSLGGVAQAQEVMMDDEEDILSPALDGTHLDDMMVEPEGVDDSLFTFSSSVEIRMDSTSTVALAALAAEPSEGVMGYRVGLFFDNSSSARANAQGAVMLCDSLYGDVVTTLSYANPYFKVSAGYCTTLEEALMLLNRLQRSFPKAFLISERIMPHHLVEVRERELYDRHRAEVWELPPAGGVLPAEL